MRLIRKLTQRLQDQRGVTLIELLAVIVILGIIAAIGIPALMDSREQAQQETYKTNASIMTEAAKRKLLMGETYGDASEDKSFNLEELLTEANIGHGLVTEGVGSEEEGGDVSNAIAYVDESDESKGVYELDVAQGMVTYNAEGGQMDEDVEATEETDTIDESGTTPEDTEPEEIQEDEEGDASIQFDGSGESNTQTFTIERELIPQIRQ